MLGRQYDELINQDNGEWQSDEIVLERFQNVFEERI
jgi:hypothetical protein